MKFTRRFAAVLSLLLVGPGFSKTHKDMFETPCPTLWLAVKDTLRNSGKYGILAINNEEMTASYNIGGALTGQRHNSLILNGKGNTCELQIQSVYTGLVNNDAKGHAETQYRFTQQAEECAA